MSDERTITMNDTAAPGSRLIELHDYVSPREDYTIACAAALFLGRGIANVKMTDIADAAGVGVATLYRHYATKTRIAIDAGTLMWRRFNLQIHRLVESNVFLEYDGAMRMGRLFNEYVDAYLRHQDFVTFLDEFDHLVVQERVPRELLMEYGQEVDSFYVVFEDAYRLGRQDGSIKRDVDFPVLYRTVAHALMGVAEKLVRGEVIPSDDFSDGSGELSCLVEITMRTLTL
jgi:AcrR family transcriptional regulator